MNLVPPSHLLVGDRSTPAESHTGGKGQARPHKRDETLNLCARHGSTPWLRAPARARLGSIHGTRRKPLSSEVDMGKILVTRHLPAGGLDPLRGHELVQRGEDVPYSRQDLLAAVSDVDAIVCLLTDRIDAEVIQAAPRLRVIGNVA